MSRLAESLPGPPVVPLSCRRLFCSRWGALGSLTSSPIRVVLVDDSDDMRLLVRIALEREPDFTVVGEAADGQTGIEAVAAARPHLVLLDIAMPVMDGLQALTLI